MERSVPQRRELCCETVALCTSHDSIDLTLLRQRFSELFDRAASRVQRAGYDLDDVLVDRFLVCVGGEGREIEAPIEFVSSVDSVLLQVGRAAGSGVSGVAVIRAGVRVWLDRGD
jgi:hypothetical protein